MHKAFKFRLYPAREQATLINKSIGCSRFTFNHFLAKWNEQYEEIGKGLTYNACSAQLTQLKKELEWLKEVDSTSLQNALKHLADAFTASSKNRMIVRSLRAGRVLCNPIPVNAITPKRESRQSRLRETRSNFPSWVGSSLLNLAK